MAFELAFGTAIPMRDQWRMVTARGWKAIIVRVAIAIAHAKAPEGQYQKTEDHFCLHCLSVLLKPGRQAASDQREPDRAVPHGRVQIPSNEMA